MTNCTVQKANKFTNEKPVKVVKAEDMVSGSSKRLLQVRERPLVVTWKVTKPSLLHSSMHLLFCSVLSNIFLMSQYTCSYVFKIICRLFVAEFPRMHYFLDTEPDRPIASLLLAPSLELDNKEHWQTDLDFKNTCTTKITSHSQSPTTLVFFPHSKLKASSLCFQPAVICVLLLPAVADTKLILLHSP